MKQVKFQNLVADILEYDNPESLDLTNPINGEEGWDSLALLGFLAMIETEYGLSLTTEDIDVSASWENFFEQFLANLDEQC
ncbi:acyl carrier protein [Flavobacteriales bacterium]|nr:acyl carrier protein [Flavobacteriales bacterium]